MIGIVINDKRSIMDNAIEFFSGGQGGHVFHSISKDQIFEMHCPRGAILRPLADYQSKDKTVLVAEPLFLTEVQLNCIKYALIEKVKNKVKYDFKGIAGQLLKIPDKLNNGKREYCSEAIADVYDRYANYRFMGLDPMIVTPHDIEYDVRSKQYMWKLWFL